jgi:hypothetical protein
LTAFSSPAHPALFRAGALMEFLALQSFLLARSRAASRRPLPSCHFAGPVTRSLASRRPAVRAVRRPGAQGFCHGFKALLPGTSSLLYGRRLSRPRARCSPGLRPLQGSPPRPHADVLPLGSSLELRTVVLGMPLPKRWRPSRDGSGSPESSQGRGWQRSARTLRTLMGFPTSSTSSSIWEEPRPGSCVHLG